MSDSRMINKELKLISNYIGLLIAKYITLAFLIILLYPMRPAPAYIIAAVIFCAPIIRYGLYSKSTYDSVENFSLLPTAKHYGFTMHKLKSEKISFMFTIFLLILWQLSINHYNSFSMPFNIFPSIILMICIPARLIGSIFFKYKLHFDFMHMNKIWS